MEQPDDHEDLMEIEEEYHTYIDDEHDAAIQRILTRPWRHERPWTIVTFGVGVASLGRRDTTFDPVIHDSLLVRIHHLSKDHRQHGDLHVYCVTPQPSLVAPPSLVLIVAVDYGEDVEDDSRVLVMEHGIQGVGISAQPYAARITFSASPACVVAQLGHRVCHPLGVNECQVEHRGRKMDEGVYYDIQHGDLLSVHVGDVPMEFYHMQRYITDAEDFYKCVKSKFGRDDDGSSKVLLRVHGISPRNAPLGHRDAVLHREWLGEIAWIRSIQQLWPFSGELIPEIVMVVTAIQDQTDEHGMRCIHLIVAYTRHLEGVPILVRQLMSTVDGQDKCDEFHAVLVYASTDERRLRACLRGPPFWTGAREGYQLLRDGFPMDTTNRPFVSGDQVILRVYLRDGARMLSVLLDQSRREGDSLPEAETVYLMQMQMTKISAQRPHDDLPRIERNIKTVEHAPVPKMFSEIQTLKQALADICDVEWQGLNRDFCAVPPMHSHALYAMQNTTQSSEGTHFHIYTDGTFKRGEAAWAFVVLCQTDTVQGPCFHRVGYAADCVEAGVASGAWDAEAMAIIAAAEYLLSRPSQPSLCIHFYYDALAVGHGSFGMQNVPNHHTGSDLQEDARIMISLLQRRFPESHGHHIKSHQGDPYNEAADSIAAHVRRGWKCPVKPQHTSQALRQHVLKHWAWLEIAPDSELPDLHTILKNGQSLEDQPQMDRVFQMLESQQGEGMPVAKTATLKLATANVGTFTYQGDLVNASENYKVNDLLQQCLEHEFDLIGVQETRSRSSQHVQNGPFARLISAGRRGQAGVELWVNEQQISQKFGFPFDAKNNITVWRQSERILAARINISDLMFDCCVIYAPQSGHAEHDIVQWWQSLHDVLQSRSRDIPLFCLGDCNAKIGSVTSDGIGDHVPDYEDTAGTCLRDLCRDFTLAVPSTFQHLHCGQSWTYTTTRGQHKRLDYI